MLLKVMDKTHSIKIKTTYSKIDKYTLTEIKERLIIILNFWNIISE